jgi:tetratricopeptide (TPR) repeat protein
MAQQQEEQQRHAAAEALLLRAAAVAPTSTAARRLLVSVRFAQSDWPGAEAAARELLALAPGDGEAIRALAYALVRQDRSPEAVELLTGALEGHDDPATRALLARIRGDNAVEAGLGRQNLAHFHVRYSGAAHEDAGRLVLRVLDRHYATLVSTFAHEPAAQISVVLLSEESYYTATGAPAWAGGHYDSFDGRVRIPIGGLSGAPPDLDEVVLHELTHAFVAEISAGVAPRDLHEGLAQFVQGRRSAALLGDPGLRALAEGRIGGVEGFYLSALAFVEELLAERGQGGINDLLTAMARTRSVDEAARQVYGKDWGSLRSDWQARFRRRYAN